MDPQVLPTPGSKTCHNMFLERYLQVWPQDWCWLLKLEKIAINQSGANATGIRGVSCILKGSVANFSGVGNLSQQSR